VSVDDDEAPDGPAEGLPSLLKGWARGAPDGRLVLCVASGILVVAASAYWRMRGWQAALSAALCVFAFGAWGIADRELRERATQAGTLARVLKVGRTTAEAIGWLALSGLVFSVLSVGMGLWKS
jgi:hypothetical protein